MAGVSGVRGVIGEGMTPEVALLWAGGFGTWLKGGKVVLSRDSRPTGEMISYAVKAGLIGSGCDVDDAGIVPTPTGALAVRKRGAAGGIIITASHNPQPWNALKFVRPDGRMLTVDEFLEIEHIVQNGPIRSVPWDRIGRVLPWDGAGLAHLTEILGLPFLDLDRLKRKKLKVAIDCVNGAGSVLYPDLLETLGCEVFTIHCTGSGLFPRQPEPSPDALRELGELVRSEKCDIGFGVDPDGDRLAAVDETGKPIGEELTLALGVKAVLTYNPGPIVANCLTSMVLDDVAAEFGVVCHRTRVGEANVSELMSQIGAVAGGEGNGGMILPAVHLVRDAGSGMALLLNLLTSSKRKLSELVAQLPAYQMIKTSIPVSDVEPTDLLEKVATFYPHDQVSRIEGVRINYLDGWVQGRSSNTEPIIRIYSEAKSKESAQAYLETFLQKVRKANDSLSHLGKLE